MQKLKNGDKKNAAETRRDVWLLCLWEKFILDLVIFKKMDIVRKYIGSKFKIISIRIRLKAEQMAKIKEHFLNLRELL